ncbi:MAG TPA: NF038122 family metalloprotease [Verrucomicrobiae bacterium]|nr:NF038122 family metalloprotease [Verrucomicrobiae bacterium]
MIPKHHSIIRFSVICGVIFGLAAPRSSALTFNLSYDASTSNAPAGFFTCFQAAINFYETNYIDPITINLNVGWGEIAGHSLNAGNLGQSQTFQPAFYTYDQIRSALMADAKSPDDATSVANLPATDPTGGASFTMANAEAKALGLLPGNQTGTDGFVGFATNASYTFDPNNRAVPGKYDFFALASHEITEIMGRYGLGQNGASSGRYCPIDLFRYLSAGNLDLVPTNGAYFSIDGGHTVINTFHGTGGGDLSDWLGSTLDSYDEALTQGQKLNISAGDLTEMDVLGYDRVVPSPSLVIARGGTNKIVISWTAAYTNFVVQTNSNLATANWQTANYSVTTANGSNYSVSITPSAAGRLFFRLKQ